MAAKTTEKKTTSKRAATTRRPTSLKTQHVVLEPPREEIAQRAFELFLARGGVHGHHEEDWLRAEREIRERHRPS